LSSKSDPKSDPESAGRGALGSPRRGSLAAGSRWGGSPRRGSPVGGSLRGGSLRGGSLRFGSLGGALRGSGLRSGFTGSGARVSMVPEMVRTRGWRVAAGAGTKGSCSTHAGVEQSGASGLAGLGFAGSANVPPSAWAAFSGSAAPSGGGGLGGGFLMSVSSAMRLDKDTHQSARRANWRPLGLDGGVMVDQVESLRLAQSAQSVPKCG